MAKISICIDVSEIDKAIQFYTKVFSCELVKKDEKYSELNLDGLTIYLGLNKAGTNPLIDGKSVRSYERHWTPVHLDIAVENLSQSVTQVKELGGLIEGEKSGDWGSIAFCSDPFGNGFCMMHYK
jgi:predicted enzyme related to lactoylglutathione lyase